MSNLEKSEVLRNGCYDNYMRFKRIQYSFACGDPGDFNQAREVLRQLDSEFTEDEFAECQRIYANARSRSKRIRRRVRNWFEVGFVYFITLTFDDAALDRSTQFSRRRAVTKFLSSHDWCYVANLDFGELKGREHYHALISSEFALSGESVVRSKVKRLPSGQSTLVNFFGIAPPEFEFWNENYGYSFVQPCNVYEDDCLALTRYLSKLTNHSIKESASSPRLIYCRKLPDWYKQNNKERTDLIYARSKSDISERFEE